MSLIPTRCQLAIVAFLLLLVVGCARVPVQEFRVYVDAFSDVRKSTEMLFEDYTRAKALQRSLDASGPPPRLPPVFDPASVASEKKAIADRKSALDAVTLYNEMLLALAEGQSVESVKGLLNQMESLFDIIAGSAFPMAGLAKTAITTVIVAAEKARSRAEFVRAFRQGTGAGGGEPIVPAILEFFIEDTATYSGVRTVITSDKLKIINKRFGILAMTLLRFADSYKPPQAGTVLAARRAALEVEYNQMRRQMNPGAEDEFFGAGTQPYDEAAHQQLENLMTPMRELAAEEQAVVDALKAYNQALRDYVELLMKTKAYLEAVGDALEQPPDVRGQAEKLIALGAELQSGAIDLQSALQAVLTKL